MPDNLKHCPSVICGSTQSAQCGNPHNFNRAFWIKCSACGASTLEFSDPDKAIAAWNHRPSEYLDHIHLLLVADAALSSDALSSEQHEELNRIIKALYPNEWIPSPPEES